MKLSFQVPYRVMDEFIDDADEFFALAHHVMMTPKYCDWFLGRPTMLDNGVHEMGKPLSIDDVLQAERMVMATKVIPPDVLYDTEATLRLCKDFLQRRGSKEGVWPVVQGRTFQELVRCLEVYHRLQPDGICLPYRLGAPWRATLRGIVQVPVHLLGAIGSDEIRYMRFFERVSMDTGKPFRFAQNGMVWRGQAVPYGMRKLSMENEVQISWAKESCRWLKGLVNFTD